MTSRSWIDRLSLATSEDELARVAREFVSELRPDELGSLPEHCRPGKIRDGEDIGDLAFRLTHLRFTPGYEPGEEGPLEAMESFFAQACAHVARIKSAESSGQLAEQR